MVNIKKWFLEDIDTVYTLLYKLLSDRSKKAWRFSVCATNGGRGVYVLSALSQKYNIALNMYFEHLLSQSLVIETEEQSYHLTFGHMMFCNEEKLRNLLLKIMEDELRATVLRRMKESRPVIHKKLSAKVRRSQAREFIKQLQES